MMPPLFAAARIGAIVTGLLCFIVLYVGLFGWALTAHAAPIVVTVLLWGVAVVPGFVVGSIARTSPIMNSLILGVIIVLIPLTLGLVFAPNFSSANTGLALAFAPFAVAGIVLCCVGGALGAYARRKIRGS